MHVYDEKLLDTFLCSKKRAVRFFTYPTGTVGSSYLFEQNPLQKDATNPEISALFTAAFQKVSAALGLRMPYEDSPPDNKVAIELRVENFDRPVYLSWYDGRQAICFELATDRGGSTIDLENEIEIDTPLAEPSSLGSSL